MKNFLSAIMLIIILGINSTVIESLQVFPNFPIDHVEKYRGSQDPPIEVVIHPPIDAHDHPWTTNASLYIQNRGANEKIHCLHNKTSQLYGGTTISINSAMEKIILPFLPQFANFLDPFHHNYRHIHNQPSYSTNLSCETRKGGKSDQIPPIHCNSPFALRASSHGASKIFDFINFLHRFLRFLPSGGKLASPFIRHLTSKFVHSVSGVRLFPDSCIFLPDLMFFFFFFWVSQFQGRFLCHQLILRLSKLHELIYLGIYIYYRYLFILIYAKGISALQGTADDAPDGQSGSDMDIVTLLDGVEGTAPANQEVDPLESGWSGGMGVEGDGGSEEAMSLEHCNEEGHGNESVGENA